MATLEENIEAYESVRSELEREHRGEWVVFHDRRMALIDAEFERIAIAAMRRFGRGPFLLRQIGEAPPPPPAWLSVRHAG